MLRPVNMPRAHASPGKRKLLPLPPDLRREELLRGYLCLSALEAGIGEQGHLGTLARMWMVSYYLYREKVKIESLDGLSEAREALLRVSSTGLFRIDNYETKKILSAMLVSYEAQLQVAPLYKVALAVAAAEAETATAMSARGGIEKMFAA